MPYIIKEAKSDEKLLACWPAIQAICPQVPEADYLPRIKKQISEECYHLMYVSDPDLNRPCSILGYRSLSMLFSGSTLYVDDLSTLPQARGKGQGGALLDWVREFATQQGYDTLSLNSGTNPGRYDAHRLYLNKGYNITSHHFVINLKGSSKK